MNYIQLIGEIKMFRPSLKRSKIESMQSKQSEKQRYRQVIEPTQQIITTSILSSKLLDPPTYPKNTNFTHLLNPLNAIYHTYPDVVTESLGEQSNFGFRAIGVYKNIYWYCIDKLFYIWTEGSNKAKAYELPNIPESMTLGRIQHTSLHFKNKNLYILAASHKNSLYLYGIDPIKQATVDLETSYKIQGCFKIVKIKFVGSNEIIVGTDSANLYHIDFTANQSITSTKKSLAAKILPSGEMLGIHSTTLIEDIIVSQGLIYCFVRELNRQNWLKNKLRKAINKILTYANRPVHDNQKRYIQVFDFNQKTGNITKKFRIREEDITNSFRIQYPKYQLSKTFEIVSISTIDQSIAVTTSCGHFLKLKNQPNLSIQGEIKFIPSLMALGQVGFFVEKKLNSQINLNQQARPKVGSSLGYRNISVVGETVFYQDEERFDFIKCHQISGDISLKQNNSEGKQWSLFSRNGYYAIKVMPYRQIVLLALHLTLENNKTKSKEIQLQLVKQKLSSWLAHKLGYIRICQILLQLLINKNHENLLVDEMLSNLYKKTQIKGEVQETYRDWQAKISQGQVVVEIKINEKLSSIIIDLLHYFQFKQSKIYTDIDEYSKITYPAYWHALRHIFTKTVTEIANIKPSNIKLNRSKIKKCTLALQNLEGVLLNKQKREKYQNKMLHYLKERPLLKTKVENDSNSTFFNTNPSNKSDAHNTTSDSITPPNQKITTENFTKLENIVSSAITKVKQLVKIYINLVEIPQSQQIPTFYETLTSQESLRSIKKYLLSTVLDQSQLEAMAKNIPELNMRSDLQIIKWLAKKPKSSEADLYKLSMSLSSDYFVQMGEIFKDNSDELIQVLFYYYDKICGELLLVQKKESTANKRKIKQAQQNFDIQTDCKFKQYLINELTAIQVQAKNLINKIIDEYVKASQQNYSKQEKAINSLIENVVLNKNAVLYSYLLQSLKSKGVLQKQKALVRTYQRYQQKDLTSANNQKLSENRYDYLSTFQILAYSNSFKRKNTTESTK